MTKNHLKNDPAWANLNPNAKGAFLPTNYVKDAKVVAWQLLNGVACCHAGGVMHRDIKPANVMWRKDDILRIGDFGLARFIRSDQISIDGHPPQTGEIQTLYYRAPEIIFGDLGYNIRVDDWSVGCCIAEMFQFKFDSRKKLLMPLPLFFGQNEIHLLMLILEFLGTPVSENVTNMPDWCNDFPNWETGSLREVLHYMDDDGFDLVSKLLVIDPKKRETCKNLLNHCWFDDIRNNKLLRLIIAKDKNPRTLSTINYIRKSAEVVRDMSPNRVLHISDENKPSIDKTSPRLNNARDSRQNTKELQRRHRSPDRGNNRTNKRRSPLRL
uniref:Protein kinase domain protein n=1 Tax=Hirondellea gigas TaxID=1518452 RepID=A0A6A7G830_9CRUS